MKTIGKKSIQKKYQAKFLACVFVAVFLLVPTTILGKTFDEYKRNVVRLKQEFAALLLPAENKSDEEIQSSRERVFELTAKLFPDEEKVELDGTTIDVNNKWIVKKLEEYKKEENTSEQKTLILTSIYEQLEAIEAKLNELSNAQDSQTTKDEQKQKLSEILTREEYEKAKPEEESLFQRILRWFDEFMKRNFTPQQSKKLPASNFGSAIYFLQILVYILVILIIGFVLYKFAPFLLKKFREREKRKKKKERFVLGEKLSADETTDNLFNEAEKLANEGNLREAIRKGYIALLFELSERKLIGLAKHKTNRDYLSSVRKRRELYENVSDLTLNYERHWYGFENADETDWEEFKTDYKKTLNKK